MASSPAGTPSDLAPEIAALRHEVVITKRNWSTFYGTELDLQLRSRGIRTIVPGGIATNFGVESTTRDDWQHGYSVIPAEDVCTSLAAEIHQFSIEKSLPPRLSRIRKVAEIVTSLIPV